MAERDFWGEFESFLKADPCGFGIFLFFFKKTNFANIFKKFLRKFFYKKISYDKKGQDKAKSFVQLFMVILYITFSNNTNLSKMLLLKNVFSIY